MIAYIDAKWLPSVHDVLQGREKPEFKGDVFLVREALVSGGVSAHHITIRGHVRAVFFHHAFEDFGYAEWSTGGKPTPIPSHLERFAKEGSYPQTLWGWLCRRTPDTYRYLESGWYPAKDMNRDVEITIPVEDVAFSEV